MNMWIFFFFFFLGNGAAGFGIQMWQMKPKTSILCEDDLADHTISSLTFGQSCKLSGNESVRIQTYAQPESSGDFLS